MWTIIDRAMYGGNKGAWDFHDFVDTLTGTILQMLWGEFTLDYL